ncbi:MAG: hypothetical protein HYR55_12740 [Acidobacteria bacterium]|nr:hypothetical protein [Acidobacteriota bacterium]MBI3657280.1 hypothetical protein [Acidobacteriota bacterium]
MLEWLIRGPIVIGAGIVWFVGLRLFLQSDLSRRRKVIWTAFLVLVGIGIGVVLPLSQVWRKFCLMIVILPVLGLADVWLLRSRRGLFFWIRACGFEVCTVFGAAATVRFALDITGAEALVSSVRWALVAFASLSAPPKPLQATSGAGALR